MISAEYFSLNEEGLLKVRSEIFMSKELNVFVFSAVILSNFISIVATIYDFDASIFLPTLFLALIFSRR